MSSHLPDPSDKKSAPVLKTALHRAAKTMTEGDRRSLLALEAAGVGTWCWDVMSDVVELDSRSKALFGLAKTGSKITYQDLLLRLHPDDRQSTEEAAQNVLSLKGEYDIIHRVIWPDQSIHWLRCKGHYDKGPRKQVVGLTIEVPWLKRSEEEHVQKEQALRRAHDALSRRVQKRTAELEQRTAEVVRQAQLLDLANDAIFVRGADDRISYWNKGAERLYGWTREEAVGQSTHDLLHTVFPISVSEIKKRDCWEGELQHTKRDGTTITVESRWTTLRDSEKRPVGWLEINTDISVRKASEQAAIRLSSRILKLQDEERRRLGRELHDGVGQYLTILKINLDLLSIELTEEQRRSKLAERLTECSKAVDECIKETRTLSHLLHPPLLDESGLASAARWYVEGFAKRSNLQVDIEIPSGLPRLPGNAELALFRVLQECLTNVHRHSGCSAVEVSVQSNTEEVTLKVKDNGCGVADGPLKAFRDRRGALGIGLAGMRERLHQLNGRLELESSREGTVVIAAVPFSRSSENGS
jgi:PAS domain S-box-containing protein